MHQKTMKELKTIFNNYIEIASKQIVKQRKEDKTKGIYRVVVNEFLNLKDLVEETEEQPAFVKLVDTTKAVFQGKQSVLLKGIMFNILDTFQSGFFHEFLWIIAIRNFFRCSGCYNKIYYCQSFDPDDLFEDYCKAFENYSDKLTYLLPLPNVQFEGCTFMDFSDFKLKKFNKDQLANIFQINVNKAFYPWAVTNIESIVDKWFICASESVTFDEIEKSYSHKVYSKRVPLRYTQLPPKIESSLKILSLCNWVHGGIDFEGKYPQDIEVEKELLSILIENKTERTKLLRNLKKKHEHVKGLGLYDKFYPFKISNVLIVHNHPLLYPLRHLRTVDDEIDDPIITEALIVDDARADYLFSHNLNTEQRELFFKFVSDARVLINNIRSVGDKWNFIDTALNCFIKAFHADGMEQLLWHIIVLEALVGGRKEIQDTLKRRISVILRETKAERKDLRKKIEDLYNYRSTVVHGDTKGISVEYEHLYLARQLARKTLLWFLNYLNYLKNKQSEGSYQLPSRKAILTLLDLVAKKEIDIRSLLDDLPKGFPNIKKWIN